ERALLLAADADEPLLLAGQRGRTGGRCGRWGTAWWGTARWGTARWGTARLGRTGARGEALRHALADRHAEPQAEALARAAAPVLCGVVDRVGGVELRVLVEVAEDAHLGALVDRLLRLGRKRDVFDDELRDLDADRRQLGGQRAGEPGADRVLVRG